MHHNFFVDPTPVTKDKDNKKTWKVQMKKQWKKMQPGSSNMQAPLYPEGGSIGKTVYGLIHNYLSGQESSLKFKLSFYIPYGKKGLTNNIAFRCSIG